MKPAGAECEASINIGGFECAEARPPASAPTVIKISISLAMALLAPKTVKKD
jgi:hypothetical protein